MNIVCGKFTDLDTRPIDVHWLIYGMVNVSTIPMWYMQLYSGVKNHQDGNYKAALFDYAVAFEAFLEEHLNKLITTSYNQSLADYLLEQNQSVESRVKKLLEFASGKRLTARDDVYQPWDIDVRQIRNKLFHGNPINVTEEMVEKAHSAVYQAIRYIETECI